MCLIQRDCSVRVLRTRINWEQIFAQKAYPWVPNKRVGWGKNLKMLIEWTPLFGTKEYCHRQLFSPALLIHQGLLVQEIYMKYPPYFFICPYLFNWHLRVPTFITKMYGNFFAINQMHQKELVKILVMVVGNVPNLILSSLLFLQFRPNAIEFI